MEIKRKELPPRTAVLRQEQTQERLIPGEPGVVQVKKFGRDSTELCRRLFKEFEIPFESYPEDMDNGVHEKTVYDYAKTKNMPGHEAHHIIPVEQANHPVIKKIGMDMNHPQNGIPLPKSGDSSHTLSTHKGFHKIYNAIVKEELDDIEERMGRNASIEELQKEVYTLQCNLRKALENGTPMYQSKVKTEDYKTPSKRKKIEEKGGGASLELWRKKLKG